MPARLSGSLCIVLLAALTVGAGCRRAGESYTTPLVNASAEGRTDDVRALLADGADPNELASGDYSPLMGAARAGNEEIAKMLIAAGADASFRLLAVVDDLLAAGADPCARSKEGRWKGLRASEIADRSNRPAVAAALAIAEDGCE